MERQQCNSLQNFDESKSDILKKRLLKSSSAPACNNLAPTGSQNNVLLNTLRAPISSSMIMSSVGGGAGALPLAHGLVTHALAPVKLHAGAAPFPLQLSAVTVPVQLPGTSSNINVPVQLSGPSSSMPLQIAPVSLPIQVSGTTNVPVQLPAGDTINVPLQIPGTNQNIQLGGPGLSSLPILHSTSQPMNSIIHLHMGSNPRSNNIDTTDMIVTSSAQQINCVTSVSQVQIGNNSVVQIPNSSNNSIQLTLPNSVTSGTVQLRGTSRSMPHVVYIQTPAGLKPVTSTEVISQASTSGNPPQIIVRRPVTSNNIHLISNVNNKPNIAPKLPGHGKSSILAPAGTPPIVIQKPKTNEKMIVPVTISSGNSSKQAIAYLGSVKKPNTKNFADNQSILISNNQPNVNSNNQKLFLTPMNMPKIQNTKFILPVTLPATMASKGPIINLQIANGQIQNDPQGNITVMRDSAHLESADMPPLQPLGKVMNVNGKDNNSVPQQNSNNSESYTMSIPGSRAEPTGEQGEYTLSIPETNAAMNDDIYTVSIADEEGGQSHEKSFTLAIPEKGKSLLNRNTIDRHDSGHHHVTVAAPAILRRSNSDNSERKNSNANLKRRISLCNENLSNKISKVSQTHIQKPAEKSDPQDSDNNDDHRVPSLFCDEKLDKDLDCKVILGDSDEDYKESTPDRKSEGVQSSYYKKTEFGSDDRVKRESVDSGPDEDPPGLRWSNGVAHLQGSGLQFQTNEFGLIETIDVSDSEDAPLAPSAKYHTPLEQRAERARGKKPASPEDLYRCDGCGCHGMAAEFITPNFCSVTCQSEVQKAAQKRRERERAEHTRRRNKMKKLLVRRPGAEPEPRRRESVGEMTEAMLKMSEELIENEKYPWMCGKNGFSWMRYLDHCKAKAAPVKLFKDPFPYNRNGFKVGMRMEAIDPQHASLFAVVSVAEVQGYRMRLHFDGYDSVHDYWVNADCADVFPAGWCERNGRALRPPRAHAGAFSWPLYLKEMRAIAAPRHLFPHIATTMVKPNAFRIGMKLEAEDRGNDMVCAATVADMLDARLLITFDSWDAVYDVWLDPASPYIHPVGWADENDIAFTPPNFYKDPDAFTWEAYLAETGASAAPPRAFKTRAPQGFKPGMKLEVVDKRVPFLIRVATISAVKGHQVRISFDGWPDELSYWLDDDSPDIHPVSWCLKTGHPLEPPLTAEEVAIPGPCGVGGCRGLGSLRGGAHKQHAAASACPYRAPASPAPPDRLAHHPPARYTLPAVSAAQAARGRLRPACPYRAPASPAPPDRLAHHPPARYTLPAVSAAQAARGRLRPACPYRAPASPAPPDRLAHHPPARYTLPAVSAAQAARGRLRPACPYRAPASPAPPDRLAHHPPARYTLPAVSAAQAARGRLRPACPYRAPASPAPPDRLAHHPPARYTLPAVSAAQAARGRLRPACPYRAPASPAPPDRLAHHPPARYTLPAVSAAQAARGRLRPACPYRAPASPAPPDRLAHHPPARYTLPAVSAAQAARGRLRPACPYRAPASPAPPDRLAHHPPARYTLPAVSAAQAARGRLRPACPYRAPASPAPPDRLAHHPPARYTLPAVSAAQAARGRLRPACPYRAPASPAPPDRLAHHPPARYTLPAVSAAQAARGRLRPACPYRAPASPAPPDRLAHHPPARYTLPAVSAAQAARGRLRPACPYRAPASPAPPDRLAHHPPARYTLPAVSAAQAARGRLRPACPYRAPASPAPPDRLAHHPPARYTLPAVSAAQAARGRLRPACPYRAPASPAPPDRLAHHPPARYTLPAVSAAQAARGRLRPACPYRAPASPAPPDRLAHHPPARYTLPAVSAAQAARGRLRPACPYRAPASPAPPDRLAHHPPARYTLPAVSAAQAARGRLRPACPYRAPASPAPPDRLAHHPPARYTLPAVSAAQAARGRLRPACPYRAPASPAPPDRLAHHPPARYTLPAVSAAQAARGRLRPACPYRAPASPAPPDRLAHHPPARYTLPAVSAAQAARGRLRPACPYRAPASPAPPDRLAHHPPARYTLPAVSAAQAARGRLRPACPYRAPASPAPPDRLAHHPPARYTLPAVSAAQAARGRLRPACPYRAPASPAPPDRLAHHPPARYTLPAVSAAQAARGRLRPACPYRAPASPAPPDRLAHHPPARYTLPAVSAAQAARGRLRPACPYRAPASPAPPDRLAHHPPARYTLPAVSAAQAARGRLRPACPYRAPASPAPPDRLAHHPPARYTLPAVSAAQAARGRLRPACPYRAPASPAPPDRLAHHPPARYTLPAVSAAQAARGRLRPACPYRAPASPAPPDRLAHHPPARYTLPAVSAAQAARGRLRPACPYRAPASPAPPDRLAHHPPARYTLPAVSAAQAARGRLRPACPYRAPASPAPPDRLAHHPPARTVELQPKPETTVTPTSDVPKEKATRGRPPKHKRVEEVSKAEPASESESECSGSARRARAGVARHVAALRLAPQPALWTQEEVCALLSAVAGPAAGAAARRARLAGRELLMASCDELVACLRLRLGPAVKVYGAVRQLRRTAT